MTPFRRIIFFRKHIINMLQARFINETSKKTLPMKYFTLEEAVPSEMTLNIIRQIAHAYRAAGNKDTRMGFAN